jgi:uncharacterized protein (TIGR03437 family)
MLSNRALAASLLTCRLAAGLLLLNDLALSGTPGTGGAPSFANLPLAFEPNQGQFDAGIRFVGRAPNLGVYLTQDRAVFVLQAGRYRRAEGLLPSTKANTATASMRLAGARKLEPAGTDRLPGMANYFIGSDASKWRTGIHQYRQVRYSDVYPGIDLIYYGNQGTLEYDFQVHANAKVSRIRLQFEGVDDIRKNPQGDLILELGGRKIIQRRPLAYQEFGGERRAVLVNYQVTQGSGQVKIQVGDYDRKRPLVIDPSLEYGTFFGGSGTDTANALTVDNQGNAYITGSTTSPNLPAESSSFQAGLAGQTNAFVAKINATGTALVYATYLGGSGSDEGNGIAVDSNGNVYICGETDSPNFPISRAITGAPSSSYNGGSDAFITALNTTGSSLIYSEYLGGSGDDVGTAIALGPNQEAYITGFTDSTDFPVLSAAQSAIGGGTDAFLAEFLSDGTLLFSTYYGGSGDDYGFAVTLSNGAPVIAGATTSPTLPGTGPTSFQQVRRGSNRDAFVMSASFNGSSLEFEYASFLGGSFDQFADAVAADSQGLVYLAGTTASTDFPVSASALQSQNAGSYDCFVALLDFSSGLQYSTYLGGSGEDICYGAALDSHSNIYVAGYTQFNNFLGNFPVRPSYQPATFVVELGRIPPASSYTGGAPISFFLGFATYLPSSGQSNPVSIAVAADQVYVAGVADQNFQFPSSATPPLQAYGGGTADAFVARLGTASLYLTFVSPPPAIIVPGSGVTFTFLFSNQGTTPADPSTVIITVPPGFTVLSCTAAVACVISGTTLTIAYPTVAASYSDTITVIASAGTTAVQNAVLSALVVSTAPNPNNFITAAFQVFGTATFTLSPSGTLDFGTVAVGQAAASMLTLIPSPGGLVDIQLIFVAENGVPASVFTLGNPSDASFTAQNARMISLEFQPDIAGARNGLLQLTDMNSNFAPILQLTGVGSAVLLPTVSGISDGAGFGPMIAANGWVTIFGTNLAGGSASWAIQGGVLPTALNGTSVMINGIPAYPYYVSPKQINVLAPRDPTIGMVTVQVTAPNGMAQAAVQKNAVAPGIFAHQPQPEGPYYADCLDLNYLLTGDPSAPAHPGQWVMLYLSGMGDTNPPYPDGAIVQDLLYLSAPATVVLNGVPIVPSFAGMSAQAAGLYQINFMIPVNTATGDLPLAVQIGGQQSQDGVFLTVAPN